MQMPEAIALIIKQIESGECHADYKRTVDLAETYRIYITGDGIEKKLIQFVQREEETFFEQRKRITKAITPAIASSIRQPFNKVSRNDRIRKDIRLSTPDRLQVVLKMMGMFYGAARKKNRGLDYWLKTRFLELQFIDPNAWIVVEWDAPQTRGEIVRPRPFEVKAAQAKNFFVLNDEVKWLFVEQDIKFTVKSGQGDASISVNTGAQPKEEKKAGKRFTLYDEDVTVVFEQVDPEYLRQSGYVLKANEGLQKIKDLDYIRREFTPKIGYVPAFRIGYKRDEQTDARTFLNPWHDALCFFEKSLKTVSELDLTMCLHTFPQKIQYVQKCPGQLPTEANPKHVGCNMGIVQGTFSKICPACNGRGIKLHTSAQDSILLPMPDDKDSMLPLEDILVYKAPPIDLIKFQNEYAQQLEKQAHQAVFNSQVFIAKAGGGITQQKGTATEADFNMQSVYDALEPFTEKLSEMWREFVTIFAIIAGEQLETVNVSHDFPADYKLKTGDILLTERKNAKESGAPAFLIETIDVDLATIIFAGDELGLQKFNVKRRFAPFMGKNEDEIAMLLTSEFVPKEPKILYSNFEQIFREIEIENPNFWVMKNIAGQRDIVQTKVNEWKERLKADAPTVTFDMFRGGAGSSAGDASGGQNPGNDANQSQQPPAQEGAAA
jgi:hypothetical protein